jgi:transposase-like protein
MTGQKHGVSALGIQRSLGLGSYQTAWAMLHRYRTAMVRPGRDRLAGHVEVDEAYLGGVEGGVFGRQSDTKAIVAVAVKHPKGFGRIRLQRVDDVSKHSLIAFIESAVEPGATVHTDGWQAYWTVPDHGYEHEHERTIMRSQPDPAHVVMPGVHRVASLLKRWLLGTHQGSVGPEHLDAYLNEFAFGLNRRGSRRRGMLLEQAVLADPITYRSLIVNPQPGRPRPSPPLRSPAAPTSDRPWRDPT